MPVLLMWNQLSNSRGNNLLFSTYYLEDGDYFRLRNIQLGYTFGANTLIKAGIQKLRVFVSGQNVKTWSKVSGYTPEAPNWKHYWWRSR